MKTIEEIASEIVDSALRVHVALGPGLLESAYEICLAFELRKRGFSVELQKIQPVVYDGVIIDAGYRLDLLVENLVVVELKVVDQLLPIHHAQILTYLKLSKKSLGFLINFNVPLLKQGIRRVVCNFSKS
jgi:GxxExxY protein